MAHFPLTGKGHATDYAVMLGLAGEDPEHIPVNRIQEIVQDIKDAKSIHFGKERRLVFDHQTDILFHKKFLAFHANGIKFEATLDTGREEIQNLLFYRRRICRGRRAKKCQTQNCQF